MSDPASGKPNKTILGRGSYPEYLRLSDLLRKETVGGILLLIAAVAALVWANSPAAGSYFGIRDFEIGYEPWHLQLSIGKWASDGLLAIFFFLTGLELKREFVAGDLRSPSRAIVPIAAAFGGVAVPALIYVIVNLAAGPGALRGWAIPTATDIAFAVAVLAVISSHLPSALRIFILTLAVVDDLIAIAIIAFFYTSEVHVPFLLWMLLPLVCFAFLTQKFSRFFARHHLAAWVILLPLGIITWALMHSSGVHATVAGVLLGFTVPVLRRVKDGGPDSGPGLAEQLEHRFRPLSTGFAVPVFAFFSAGVALGGWDGFTSSITDSVALGIILGLFLGKPIGIMLTTWVLTKATKANLDPSLKWIDVLGVAILAGVGFTVSLLVNDLSFALGSEHHDHAKVAVLSGSLISALVATVILRARNRHYRRIEAEERVDANQDGIPDVYEEDTRG
ncbi:pH-dependent sodium/proton antiporter [Arthrobacter crystallopoietes BAB-32]|uniref:Na(+)/H(+) antiporter NhaA n=1 Tax=Arthrobacter crystallopoietes BAB-32 TaxID=1246476 RepID=N1V0Y4_9MICC|nr:Na+/H+ antiporter NhaA [Arthrobacter crystallopoietes]EMY33689.1 pH-dependent sodium/proton antiporter [Arthrobacter crystallopoietes BAB-32]